MTLFCLAHNYLNDAYKLRKSNEIDYEANRFKNDWYCQLRQMSTTIKY